jgi:hypothetical protein
LSIVLTNLSGPILIDPALIKNANIFICINDSFLAHALVYRSTKPQCVWQLV